MEDKIKLHEEILNSMHQLYISKNSDYGDSVHETYTKFKDDAFLVRMYDKLNRAYTLTRNKQQVKDESIEDTLLDLANYAILNIIERRLNNECKSTESNLKR